MKRMILSAAVVFAAMVFTTRNAGPGIDPNAPAAH